ncbi:MAG: M48 family metallopeptidase [Nanoarchaeota archaeon]
MKTDSLEANGIKYLVKIFYEDRSNTAVSIGKKSVNIRIPLSMDRNEQFRNILKMKQWAKEKLEKSPPKKERAKEYADGELLKAGNAEYKLSISFAPKQSSSARLHDKIIYLCVSSDLPKEVQNRHISSLLSRIIGKQKISIIKEKINELNEKHFKQKINKIFFKNHQSKWGSCSINGNINISTRLLFAPDDVLEYVCIHELVHLIEHNHSDRFWALVEKAVPDYKEKEKWLKENGEDISF